MNLANSNAQGTRPKVVGQMTELIQEFGGNDYNEWVDWYLQKRPNSINTASTKVLNMVENLKEAINLIDEAMVRQWTEDLVFTKTFTGLCFQESILKRIAAIKGTTYRMAEPQEESRGIDGYIADKAVSIKPDTYKTKAMYGETIEAEIIYYSKKSDGITVSYDF
jgi:hypothetical protein